MIGTSQPFSVLFVCTGNICRSPIAEQLFAARFDSSSIEFASAGIAAYPGQPMPGEAVEILRTLGVTPTDHAARSVTAPLIERADLVVALAREHRREVVRTVPRANRYTFTLRELARLCESLALDQDESPLAVPADDVAECLRALVPAVASRRGYGTQVTPEEDDVIDPYGRDDATYALAGEQIETAFTIIVNAAATIEHQLRTSNNSDLLRPR